MKRYSSLLFLSLLLVGCSSNKPIVPTEKDINAFNKYEHIVIFGVDGAGVSFKDVDTPNFDCIFSQGSINYNGVAESPTSSAENWASMFYGVSYKTHKKSSLVVPYTKHTDESLPSFIKTYAIKHKNASFYSAVSWTPINTGLLEDIPQLVKDNVSEQSSLSSLDIDMEIAKHVVDRFSKYHDTIIFMQFDSVDDAGHTYGGGSNQYYQAIQYVDALIGDVYKACSNKDKTLFICVSDHGMTKDGNHGGDYKEEKDIMFAVNGGLNNIIKGSSKIYRPYDLASVVLFALGEKQPTHYEGGVPRNLFTTLK